MTGWMNCRGLPGSPASNRSALRSLYVWPFMIAQLIVLFLMILFPSIVTVPEKWFSG